MEAEKQNSPMKYIPLLIALILIGGVLVFVESMKSEMGGSAQEVGENDVMVTENVDNIETADTEAKKEALEAVLAEKKSKYEPAKEISTPDAFINVDDISVQELIGDKIVLVDFWTYSCINCQRTLPYLNSWHEKYADDGLVILGVHTPEFEFEKKLSNVQKAVDQFNVEYPVILDNDFSTWRSYNNRYWPRKYLIDIDGYIVYDHIGEGAYEETEQKIVEALNEKNRRKGLPEITVGGERPAVDDVDFGQVGTPEIYFGSARIEHLANAPSSACVPGTCTYEAPKMVARNSYALEGEWEITPEKMILKSDTGSILLRFYASNVNVVAGAEKGATFTTVLDGYFGEEIDVSDETLYRVFDSEDEYGEHLLEIKVDGAGAEFYTFTFG